MEKIRPIEEKNKVNRIISLNLKRYKIEIINLDFCQADMRIYHIAYYRRFLPNLLETSVELF